MQVEFRRAYTHGAHGTGDLPAMMEIVAAAQAFLGEQGVDQWQNGYPDARQISADIENGNAYVLTAEGKVAAMAALVFGDEADYRDIRGGTWSSDGPYATLHRLALAPAWRGGGLAEKMVAECAALARKAGMHSLRTDTHKGNVPMQKLLHKCGFTYRGDITIAGWDDDADKERIAFDLVL